MEQGIQSGRDVRGLCRNDRYDRFTAGMAPGFVQGNIVILTSEFAGEFETFCHRNPSACPLLAISERGLPSLPSLGEDIDIRTDLPRYCIWRNGTFAGEANNVLDLWSDDLVTFALGCSFSFEDALVEKGVRLRHLQDGTMPSAYRTNLQTKRAGRFHGPLVVSMRALTPSDVVRAIQITTRFPRVHGAPIHVGKPELIGIDDIEKPDFGDPPGVRSDELPVFWACGVTPQSVILNAKPDFCITHAPGCMLVTDLKNAMLASF